MKVLVLYRPASEYARMVEEFVQNLTSRHNQTRLEVVDIDSRDGTATASLYDIMTHPAVLVLQEDGSLQKSWVGSQMPLVDEVVSYART